MKKAEENVIYFKVKDGDNEKQLIVRVEDLEKIIQESNVKGISDVIVRLTDDNKNYEFPMKLKKLKTLVKQAVLMKNIIPNQLSRYVIDVTQRVSNRKAAKILEGRDNEIEKVWFYLSQKNRNNVFLIGEKEVGKTAIVNEIIRQISTNECPKEFYETRVFMIRPELLLVDIKSGFKFEILVKRIITLLKSVKEKTILYIDNPIYMLANTWLIYALYIFIKKLNIPIITTTSEEDFYQYFLEDSNIAKHINYIYVEEPEIHELEPILKKHIAILKKQYGLDISEKIIKFGIVTSMLDDSVSVNPGKTINIFKRAFLEAKRKDKTEVDKESILSCYKSYIKLYNSMTEETKRSTAYHETGHYLLMVKNEHVYDEKVAFASILPMMDFLGVTWPYTIEGQYNGYSREYYIDQIAIYMAGRIGEYVYTKEYTTSLSTDIRIAENIAENAVMMLGLSENKDLQKRCYISNGIVKEPLLSDQKKKEIDEEVQKLMNEGYARAEKIINENKELLSIIAEKLLENEILTGEELEKICEDYKMHNNK